jgi:hypothetical protein
MILVDDDSSPPYLLELALHVERLQRRLVRQRALHLSATNGAGVLNGHVLAQFALALNRRHGVTRLVGIQRVCVVGHRPSQHARNPIVLGHDPHAKARKHHPKVRRYAVSVRLENKKVKPNVRCLVNELKKQIM